MIFQVTSSEEAAKALSYYNYFHDSFLEALFINVIHESSEGFGFGLPVRHDATLHFVHSNYPAAEACSAGNQRVQMRLIRLRSLHVGDILAVDNMLQECLIEVRADGGVSLDVGGDGLLTFTSDALTIEEAKKVGDVEPS